MVLVFAHMPAQRLDDSLQLLERKDEAKRSTDIERSGPGPGGL